MGQPIIYAGLLREANVLNFTESAIKKITEILAQEENACLRVFVSGGGCSGFQYGFFIEKQDDVSGSDTKLSCGDSLVVVDKDSLSMLKGSTIDYNESIMGSGFKIDNPNAAASCGCGKSFAPKDGGGCSGCD